METSIPSYLSNVPEVIQEAKVKHFTSQESTDPANKTSVHQDHDASESTISDTANITSNQDQDL